MIDVSNDLEGACLAVCLVKVLHYPLDEVIFECTLDDLMQQVGGYELVDFSAWKVVRERL